MAVVKAAVFWDVMPYCLVDDTNVSKEPAASVYRAEERTKWGKVAHDTEKGGLNKSVGTMGPINGHLISGQKRKMGITSLQETKK
jgi:hypothetical protein